MTAAPEYNWPGDSAAQGAGEGLDIGRYLAVLIKFKWGILSVALLAAAMGLYSAYKAVPIYRSQAVLQIERDTGPNLGNLLGIQPYQWEFYNTQYELLRSWGVAELAAQRLDLLNADHLEGRAEPPPSPGFSWRSLIPSFLRNEPPVITPEVRRERLIAGIQGSVRISPIDKSELVSVAVESANPEWASRVANAVSESYIDFLREKNLDDITGSQDWYASRLEKARTDLEEAELALQEFLDRQGLVQTSEGVDALQSQALQLALSRREEARQQKLALGRLYRSIRQAREGTGSLGSIAALDDRGIVRQLKNELGKAQLEVNRLAQRYGPKHPRMLQAQTNLSSASQAYTGELENAAEGVVADYERAVQAEAAYDAQLGEAQADIQALNRSRAELTKLQDDVKTSRALFEELQSGEKTAGVMEGGLQKINATVIEFARPALYPVRPNKQRMVLVWALGGLLLGIGLAFLLDHLDSSFKGAEDVEQRLALPVLGILPQLKLDKGDKNVPMSYVLDKPNSAFSEAIRTVRTGVLLSTLEREHTVVVITSSTPEEGKTTLAINFAHVLQQVKPTILVDADMRRPAIHRAKEFEPSRKGLATLVTGECTLEEAVIEMEDGLHVIPAGKPPPNPLELLSSPRFQRLIEQLKERYEAVVIDSAPSLAVSDALVVSQLSDALLYVVRADTTPVRAAEQGLKRLRRVNAPVQGVVLNRVQSPGAYYSRYGKLGRYYNYVRYGYYHQDYYQGYHSEEIRS